MSGIEKNTTCLLPKEENTAILYIQPYINRADRQRVLADMGIVTEHSEQGQPIVLSPEGIYLSITHACDLQLLLFSHHPCGIDIEPRDRVISHGLQSRMNLGRDQDPLGYWTEMEAYAKLTQTSLFSILRRTDSLWPPEIKKWSLLNEHFIGSIMSMHAIKEFLIVGDEAQGTSLCAGRLIHTNIKA